MVEQPPGTDGRVLILSGFSDPEIVAVMNAVKALYSSADPEVFSRFAAAVADHPEATDFSRKLLRSFAAARRIPEVSTVSTADIAFAKTTSNSVQMKLADLLADVRADHEHLRRNPPGGAR